MLPKVLSAMDQTSIDLALFVFRLGVGAVMLAHGVNHVIGGGKIEGTAGWFGSMGMKAPRFQAWLASLTEIGAGIALIVGLLTPLGAGGVVGTMVVAFVINHRGNGFFIFRPGEGWEYIMVLGLCAFPLGAIGAGRWSLDHALDITTDLDGWTGLALSVGLGTLGALLVLVTSWRPAPAAPDTE